MTTASSLADACPNCFPDAEHPVLPLADPVPDRGSLKARYRHDVCGTEWECWWNPDALSWPLRREETAA